MTILLPRERQIAPAGPTRINRSTPLARGLVSLLTTGSGAKDLASGAVGTQTNITTGLTTQGRAWVFDGNTSLIDFAAMPPGLPDLSGTYTMAAIVVADSASPARTITQIRDASSLNTHICYNPNNSFLGLESAASGSGKSVAVTSGRTYVVIGSATGGTPLDAYVNGVAGSNQGSSGITASTQVGYSLGKRIGGTSFSGRLLLSAIWNRFLSAEEKRYFTRNPWALFARSPIWIETPISSGGIDLAGAASVQSSADGALSTQINLAGGASVQSSSDGGLSTQINLAGGATVQSSASGGLSTSPAGLSGGASASSSASGNLSTQISLAGDSTAQSSASGSLSAQIHLAGGVTAQSSSSGTLTTSSTSTALVSDPRYRVGKSRRTYRIKRS